MNKFIDYINKNISPKLNKITRNVWIGSVQDSIMILLPFILVGSLVSLINSFGGLIKGFPDLSPINNFTFGLLGLLLVYLIPNNILQKKKVHKFQTLGGFTGVGVYLMMSGMTIGSNNTAKVYFINFGASGMFVAMILGILISLVMIFFNKHSFFKNNVVLPEIVVTWFDSLIPIFLCFFIGWVISYLLNFNVFDIIGNVLAPLFTGSNTMIGLILIVFIQCLVYSFGISTWSVWPIIGPILFANTAANVAAGAAASNIATYEVVYSGWCAIGGMGSCLPLAIMMFRSKSKRINAIGKASIVPAFCNINEPIVFGLPVALNPIMMIPLWINGLVVPIITYLALKLSIVPIPHVTFTMNFLPSFITTYFISNNSFVGPLLALFIFAVSTVIWYPFFKAYEKNVVQEEISDVK